VAADKESEPTAPIGQITRAALIVSGLAAWGGGGAATFIFDNGAGAAALITSGILVIALGAIGRWPSKLVISGNEVHWSGVRRVVTSQLESARSEDADEETITHSKICYTDWKSSSALVVPSDDGRRVRRRCGRCDPAAAAGSKRPWP
jgi:hypothetical protein